jgi:hypothetical protein
LKDFSLNSITSINIRHQFSALDCFMILKQLQTLKFSSEDLYLQTFLPWADNKIMVQVQGGQEKLGARGSRVWGVEDTGES